MNNLNSLHIPVGLEPIVNKVADVCFHSDIFRRCGVKPNHFLINLDTGNGRTTLTTFVSDAFHSFGIRHFGGLDRFLEFTLDGTMAQLKEVLNDIRSCAVYTNEYEGVISIDISAMAAHLNESQLSTFLKALPVIGEHATLILYVPSKINRNMTLLIEKVCAALGEKLEVVKVEAYSEQNLVDIIKELIDETGVSLEDDADIDSCILAAVRQTGARTVKDAKQMAQVMVKNANFNHFIPVLTSELINSAFNTIITKEVK